MQETTGAAGGSMVDERTLLKVTLKGSSKQ